MNPRVSQSVVGTDSSVLVRTQHSVNKLFRSCGHSIPLGAWVLVVREGGRGRGEKGIQGGIEGGGGRERKREGGKGGKGGV